MMQLHGVARVRHRKVSLRLTIVMTFPTDTIFIHNHRHGHEDFSEKTSNFVTTGLKTGYLELGPSGLPLALDIGLRAQEG